MITVKYWEKVYKYAVLSYKTSQLSKKNYVGGAFCWNNIIKWINGSLLFEAVQNNEKIIYGNNMQMLKEPEMGG